MIKFFFIEKLCDLIRKMKHNIVVMPLQIEYIFARKCSYSLPCSYNTKIRLFVLYITILPIFIYVF